MLDEQRIQEIVERVVARLGQSGLPTRTPTPGPTAIRGQGVRIPRGTLGAYDSPDDAVRAATRGFEQNEKVSLETRRRMIQAMRDVTRQHVRELSEYAVAETGLGRVDDKIKKNTLVLEKTPGTEILAPRAFTGDDGLALVERAPYGVFLAVTPCTNPTETILCNAIGMLAGGNAVVFNVHPAAAQVSAWHVHLLNEAIAGAGGPRDAITTMAKPTIASAQALMEHPGVRILVVTGGPAVVKAALSTSKKVIAAGPGNPPVLVDETANLEVAAQGIIDGASMDNNIVCIAEKEVLVVASVADALRDQLVHKGCVLLGERHVREVEKVVMDGEHTSKSWVGKNAGKIAEAAGIRGVDDRVRLLVCEVDEQHPFVQHELLMPVVGLVRVRDAVDGMAMAKRVEHGFGHTAVMYSTNVENMSAMARIINTSIFVKNAPSLAGLGHGGEGYTSFTIASPTGEGLTTALNFTRERRCTLKDAFRFV